MTTQLATRIDKEWLCSGERVEALWNNLKSTLVKSSGIGSFFYLPLVRFGGGSVKVQALIDVEHQVISQPQVSTSAPSSVTLHPPLYPHPLLSFYFFMTTFCLLGSRLKPFPVYPFWGSIHCSSTPAVLWTWPDTTIIYQKISKGLDWATFALLSSYCGTSYGPATGCMRYKDSP